MDVDSPDKQPTKDGMPNFIPGTIKRIKLQNFMCHDSFELTLGPRVNFVIGPNGSGKSALLTAIVVVLGGRATTTSRGKKNSEFVQYGKSTAKITLEIHNYEKIYEKEKAFKPDEYGKRIIIEKIIPKDPEQSAKLILKNDREKRISERKQELDELLDFFSIQINNPICILNQEVSKSFLHSKKPEDKFNLFMKATNLEQIENDYNEARENHTEWSDCNHRKAYAFKQLDEENRSCRHKLGLLMNRAKLQEQVSKLEIEHICALLRQQEDQESAITEKIEEKRQLIADSSHEISKREDKIKSAQDIIEQHQSKVRSCSEEFAATSNKCDDLKRKKSEAEKSKLIMQGRLERENYRLKNLEKDKASLLKSIEEIKNKQESMESERQNQKMKLEIEQLEREKPEFEAREKSLRERADQLRNAMRDMNSSVSAVFDQVKELRMNVAAGETNLRSLAREGSDLRKYGPHHQRICELIDQAFKEGRFKQRPYGPVGRYIKVKTQSVSPALEIHLGNFARAFVCDNNSDMVVLDRIFKSVKASAGDANFREPNVFVRKYQDRFDANRFKAVHPMHKSLIDLIEVTEAPIYNALLDRSCLEQALFIPDYNEAQTIMITPNLIPKGTRVAYTQDRHIMYPRTRDGGFRIIADDRDLNHFFSKCNQEAIDKKKTEIEHLKEDLRGLEHQYERLKAESQKFRNEYDGSLKEIEKNMGRVREIENRLFYLRTEMQSIQPQELSLFEDELEKNRAQVQEMKLRISSLKSQELEPVEAQCADIVRELKSAQNLLKLKQEERDKVNSSIQSEKDLIKTHKESLEEINRLVNAANTNIDELSKQLESIHADIARYEASLTEHQRPSVVRSIDIVTKELKKVKARLNVEIDENRDPEELMASLRKRMDEIEHIVDLRDKNARNFEMTSNSLKVREDGFNMLRCATTGKVSTTFSSVMRVMDMTGEMEIYLSDKIVDGKVVAKAKTLEMSIDTSRSTQRAEALTMSDNNNVGGDQPTRRSTRGNPDAADAPSRPKRLRPHNSGSPSEKENQRMTDTRSLSGGERSFSTVAFVLSLWHHCQSPFKLMDEIDVFMDMVTRRMSYNALIRFAQKTEAPGQFIYFSPLELPEIDSSENMVRVFEMPRIIRRGVSSLPVNLDSMQER